VVAFGGNHSHIGHFYLVGYYDQRRVQYGKPVYAENHSVHAAFYPALFCFTWVSVFRIFVIIPSVAALKLMLGAYHGISGFEMAALAIYLFAINYILLKLAVTTFEKRIVYQD
jgi:hypothetical protein